MTSGVFAMKFVRNMENFFEKHIEGFFDKKLSGGLQPVEIAKILVRTMEKEKSIGVSSIYVPNAYCVYLQPADFDRIASYHQTVCQDLAEFLAVEAKKKEYVMTQPPMVEIKLAEESNQGRIYCLASFSEPLPSRQEVRESISQDVSPATRVFNKMSLEARQPIPAVSGLLAVVEGPDAGLKATVGVRRIHIGRRESNEMPLTDINTSRLHAYIAFDGGSHVLHDANSLNGTYVNNHRITFWQLKSGDKIRLGNTIIVYEVN
ncbi:MAG: domain containing protein [Firmicutes bacterium]|nr:domain containing protein [Bacillota bacterium]